MWDLIGFRNELKELVNIDSDSTDRAGVGQIGQILAGKYRNIGLHVEAFDDYTCIQAKSHPEADFDVLLVGHMDTVFPKGTVRQRPYSEDEKYAYGPGVADMKAGLVMVLHLVRKLRETNPSLRICIANDGDEETDSVLSYEWLKELSGHAQYAYVFEPGRTGNGFIKSRKGYVGIEADFRGIAAHAGNAPEKGASAIKEMARWIMELTALQNLAAGTSVNAGIVNGGTSPNVIADHAKAYFDVRVQEMSELNQIKVKVQELKKNISVLGVTVDIKYSGEMSPMSPSQETRQMIEHITKKAEDLRMEIHWLSVGGVSDANHLAGWGVPVICGCGPCGGNLHNDKEYLELYSLESRLELMYQVLADMPF